jgi:hypothetical protein
VFISCESIFETEDNTLVTENNILNGGYPAARLAVQGSYERLVNVLDNVTYYTEIATENADETDSYQGSGDIDMGQFHAGLTEGNEMYSGLHDARKQSDLFLTQYVHAFDFADQLPTSAPSAEQRKRTFIAFSTLVRGWSTLYLGLIFREVNFNRGPRRTPAEAIAQAMSDFTAVETMYAGSIPPEAEWIGVDIRKSANTLLAKAHLQLGNYADALTASAKGLKSTDPAGVNEVFAPYANPADGMAMFTAGFADAYNARTRMSMSKFYIPEDPKDERVDLLPTTADGTANTTFGANDRETFHGYDPSWASPLKISKYYGGTTAETPIRVLSWQENMLISAEARIKSGDIAGGIADINAVRAVVTDDAGAAVPPAFAADETTAMQALEYEIRMEFAVELGMYFQALRRWDRTHYFRAGAKYAFEIPLTE